MPIQKGGGRKIKSPRAVHAPRATDKIESLEKEVNDLSLAIEELHDDIRKMIPKSAGRRAMNSIGNGVLRGLGFIIGTTVIAAILIFGIQQALQSQIIQDWISSQFSTVIEKSIENAKNEINIPFFKN